MLGLEVVCSLIAIICKKNTNFALWSVFDGTNKWSKTGSHLLKLSFIFCRYICITWLIHKKPCHQHPFITPARNTNPQMTKLSFLCYTPVFMFKCIHVIPTVWLIDPITTFHIQRQKTQVQVHCLCDNNIKKKQVFCVKNNGLCSGIVRLKGDAQMPNEEWERTNDRRRVWRYSQLLGTFPAAAAGLWLIDLHRYNCSRSRWLSLVSKAL